MNYITRWFEHKRFVEELKKENINVFSLKYQEKVILASFTIGACISGIFQVIYGPFWYYFDVFENATFGYFFSTAMQIFGFMGVAWVVIMVFATIKMLRFNHAIKKLERNLEAINPLRRWEPGEVYRENTIHLANRACRK